jgi:hypothetical protein
MKEDLTARRIKNARNDQLYDKMIGQLELNPVGVIVIDPTVKDGGEEAKAQALVWDRWQEYLGRVNRRKTLKACRGILSGGGKLTLPCLDPNEMDSPIFRNERPTNRYWDK